MEDINDEAHNCGFLFKLPTEIRVLIYEKLSYEDVLVIRSVCRQTKQDVDMHLNFHARIDQSYRGFRKLFRFRLRSCYIVHLKHTHCLRSFRTDHPNLMKKITFDGHISSKNLYKVLFHFKSLENLVFTHETLGVENLLGSLRIQTCLQTLTSITHLNLQYIRYPLSDPFESEINISTFLETTFPHLISFQLFFSVWGNWIPLLLFLERHAETVKYLELQVGDRGDSKNTEIYLQSHPHTKIRSHLNMKRLKQMKLRHFRFRDDVLNLNASVKSILMDIINEQTLMETFQFHSPGELSVENLRRILLKNSKTLKEVAVYTLKTQNTQVVENMAVPGAVQQQRIVFDMGMFAECVNIKVLALSCCSFNNNDNPQQADSVEMKLINLNCVPPSIERLHINGFSFSGDDVVKLSHTTSNLKEFLVSDAGSMMYSKVLTNMLMNCKKLEYVSVRPIHSIASGDENWYREINQLSLLYNRFMGTSYDPLDDLDGFEANIKAEDRVWIETSLHNEILRSKAS